MSKEKSPQDWNKTQRLEAIMHCHSLNDAQMSSYCRTNGIYPHHLTAWKTEFVSDKQVSEFLSRQTQKKLRQENKRLHKELNRKDKALSKTAALLVLSKKCQAIWGGGKGGRLIAFPDRKNYCDLIDEAVQKGARQKLACELVGIFARTYQRWNQSEELLEDQRIYHDAPVHNKLSEAISKKYSR